MTFSPKASADLERFRSPLTIVNPSDEAIARCRASRLFNPNLNKPIQSRANL